MTTTAYTTEQALEFFLALPEHVQSRYESKIVEARKGTLSQALFFQVKRQIVGAVAPAETEAARKPGQSNGNTASNYRSHDASDAQRRFAMDLLRTRVAPDERIPGTVKTAAQMIALVDACDRMSKDVARSIIDSFKDRPRPQAAAKAPWTPSEAKAAPVELEAGIYRLEDKFYKVQKAVHGSGRMYAKVLVVDGPGSAHFEYASGAIRQLTPDHKIGLEEAKQFGHVYGVCVSCGATLTDEKSIEAGIGPVCAKKL